MFLMVFEFSRQGQRQYKCFKMIQDATVIYHVALVIPVDGREMEGAFCRKPGWRKTHTTDCKRYFKDLKSISKYHNDIQGYKRI